ncbi:MAG: dTDP-4-dehydrorhamnose 3,5-epimerase [Candidatus Dormibacteraeota bacterium]|nr:dTDP-4-dehydrorhamnose 3,5-epimerase [Candidatus Dormibacteraeota bacterium]MBV9526277.1 dTDP-4-dehydrorhamnose 3,5-epimerase [Candidatus Dormibacteraeota bacterium]
MRFTDLPLSGAVLVELEPRNDDRGFFARTFCAEEFAAHGLSTRVVQCNLSCNRVRGTVRGLHYQLEPSTEAKLIRCVRGAVHSVIVDVRPESPTYLRHLSVDLLAEERRALYVPEMFANGYQTLSDGAEIMYQVSEFYAPEQERGLRYDDPALGIPWPLAVACISPKDASWPLLATPAGVPSR